MKHWGPLEIRVASPAVFAVYILTWQELNAGDLACGGTEKFLKVWWICRSAGLWTSSGIANSENISTGDTMAWQVEKPWDYLKVRDWLHGVGVMSRTTGPRIQGTP